MNNSLRNFFFVTLVVLLSLNLGGCGWGNQQRSANGEGIVARINSYKMSAADFKDRVEFLLTSKYLSVEPNQAKEELLNELINRNVLLQEAQRQDLDKQKAFMREIERYWEQSLLKLLLRKKSQELSEKIIVDDSEAIEEYRRMKRRILAKLVIFNDQKAANKLSSASSNKFEEVQNSLQEKIVSGETAEWWILGDLPAYLEQPLFSLQLDQASPTIKCGDGWAVIKVLAEEQIEIEPFKNLAAVIKSNIQKRKRDQQLEQWIKDLRQDVSIRINKDVLRGINLE